MEEDKNLPAKKPVARKTSVGTAATKTTAQAKSRAKQTAVKTNSVNDEIQKADTAKFVSNSGGVYNDKSLEELSKLNKENPQSNKSKSKVEKIAAIIAIVIAAFSVLYSIVSVVSTLIMMGGVDSSGIGGQAVLKLVLPMLALQLVEIAFVLAVLIVSANFLKSIKTGDAEKRNGLRKAMLVLSILTGNLITFIMLLVARKLRDDYRTESTEKLELEDLEAIHEQNLRNMRARSTRNKVAIIILSILLAIAIAVICSFLGVIYLENNVFLYVKGADAEFIVDGVQMDKFRAPNNIAGNSTLVIDTKLKIESAGTFNVEFEVFVYQNNNRIENTFIVETFSDEDHKFMQVGYCKFKSLATVSGGRTIDLFEGIVLDESYKDTLNANNIKIEIRANLTRV